MTAHPKRKNLSIVERNGRTYYKVQINKATLGLKVNKTFKDYQQAIEFLNACENKLGQKSVKTLLEAEDATKRIIEEYMSEPPLSKYMEEYIKTYVMPKYEQYNTESEKNKYKLRQRDTLLSKLRNTIQIPIEHEVQTDWKLSPMIYSPREKTKLADLKPREITADNVNQLILALKKKGLKPLSISDYISKLSVFWRKIGHLDRTLKNLSNPFLMYDKDLITMGEKRFKKKAFRFTSEKLRKVVEVFKANGNPEFRAIIHLMYKLGLRRQEAILLEKSQISEKPTPNIYIQSKNTERIVYLNERQWRFVKSLIKPDQERLFTYKVLGFDGSFVKPFRKHEIDQHSFRKDYVSRMIEKIGLSNSILLSQLLGLNTPRAIERLKGTIAEPQMANLTQAELLKQIGHANSRITAEHYFSFKQ